MSVESSQQSDYDDSDSDVASNPKRRNNRGSKRKHWMKEEDNAIVELVREYGTKDWTLISKMIKQKYGINKRSAKQCRERWHNHLDPNIKKDPLCIEEEKRLFELHKIYGNKWAQIANEMEGRTDNTIKNHFYSTLRRQLRKINNLLLSTKFELLYGRKMKEVTLDDLYKYLKDCDGEYDDIKGIYSNAIDSVSKLKIDEFKYDANNLIGKERDTEAIKTRHSRRSTRIKDNGGIKQSQEEEPNQVGFYVLMKILKCFREEHKNELFKFDTLEVDQASNNIYKNSCNSIGKSSNNKRVSKEVFKENQKENDQNIKNNDNNNDSSSVNQTLVPSNIRSLFSKMKTKELNDNESDDDKDNNKFKFQQSNLNSTTK